MTIDTSLAIRRAKKNREEFEARSAIIEQAYKDVAAMEDRGELPKRDNLTLFTAGVAASTATVLGGMGYSMYTMNKEIGGSYDALQTRCQEETGQYIGEELTACVDAVFQPAQQSRNDVIEGTTYLAGVFVLATIAAGIRAKLRNDKFGKAHDVAMKERIAALEATQDEERPEPEPTA